MFLAPLVPILGRLAVSAVGGAVGEKLMGGGEGGEDDNEKSGSESRTSNFSLGMTQAPNFPGSFNSYRPTG